MQEEYIIISDMIIATRMHTDKTVSPHDHDLQCTITTCTRKITDKHTCRIVLISSEGI